MTGPCAACGLETVRPLCYFCQRTADLIRERRCVSCGGRIFAGTLRVEGRCHNCRSQRVRLSAATNRLLQLAAKTRFVTAA